MSYLLFLQHNDFLKNATEMLSLIEKKTSFKYDLVCAVSLFVNFSYWKQSQCNRNSFILATFFMIFSWKTQFPHSSQKREKTLFLLKEKKEKSSLYTTGKNFMHFPFIRSFIPNDDDHHYISSTYSIRSKVKTSIAVLLQSTTKSHFNQLFSDHGFNHSIQLDTFIPFEMKLL